MSPSECNRVPTHIQVYLYIALMSLFTFLFTGLLFLILWTNGLILVMGPIVLFICSAVGILNYLRKSD